MTMYLVGGGPSEGLDNVHDQFVEQARRRGTRVLVALLGEHDEVGHLLDGYTGPITSRWPEAEIVPVWLDDEPDDGQNTTVWPDDLESLAGIVIAGGWTPGYLEALRPQRQLIATLVRRGVPYLGYSAGAMVVSKRTIVGGWKFRGRQVVPELWGEGIEELEVRDGLALIGPTVDSHSDVTGLGAGLAALEKGGMGTVVSIDEATALVVDPVSGRTVVEGTQRVHWLTREQGVTVVRHESSEAEKQRHAEFEKAEQEAAEREAAERAEREQAAREQAEQAQAEQDDVTEATVVAVTGPQEDTETPAPAEDTTLPPAEDTTLLPPAEDAGSPDVVTDVTTAGATESSEQAPDPDPQDGDPAAR